MDAAHRPRFDTTRTPGPVATTVSVYEAKQGFEQLLLEELTKLVRQSRQEVGNLLFDLYRIAGEKSTFALHEVWEEREAMEVHERCSYTTRFKIAAERYLVRPAQALELEELL